ncbi:MAG: ABC transporter substrate-binding protein [Candidatus Hodarchaeales archaeon]|jgi:ABC-type transport system substrate-binding protein
MKAKNYMLLGAVFVIGIFAMQMGTSSVQVGAVDAPPGYLSITLIAPTNNPARVQHAQVITRELWKIGIEAELALVGWDPLLQRLRYSVNYEGYDGDGFDILFVGWTAGNPTNPASLEQFYHSRRIDKVAGADNYAPINSSRLDEIIDRVDTELDFEQRREYVRQALDIVLWGYMPNIGLYQAANPFALDVKLKGFDAFRWGQPNLHVPELSYEDDQTIFKFASNARFIDLNPFISSSYYDSIIFQPTRSFTYMRDATMNFKPVLATQEPIPIGSNDLISESVAAGTIDADSPFAGETTWGDHPTVDPDVNATKTAEDYSMFLINLRTDIPWHPGWGYDLGDEYVTVDDFQWALEYIYEEDLAARGAAGTASIYGDDPYAAIQKINDTMMKLNIRGPLGDGRYSEWYTACSIAPMPQHILDPDLGSTPDGTTIAPYADSREYAYNTGVDADHPPLGCGAYYFENWDDIESIATLRKFDEWGGSWGSETSLWDTPAYSGSNIETYAVTVYPSKESAEIALENGDIDGIDAQFQMGPDIPYLQTKSNIQVLLVEGGGIQTMAFNTKLPALSDRYVRLAIGHMVPAQKIVDFILGGLGSVNELVGIALANPYKPNEQEFKLMGLDVSENVVDPETGETLEFQGHIRYNINKAWALMEKAGYDMDPWRKAVAEEEEEAADEDSPMPILPVVFAVLSLALLRLVHRSRKRK